MVPYEYNGYYKNIKSKTALCMHELTYAIIGTNLEQTAKNGFGTLLQKVQKFCFMRADSGITFSPMETPPEQITTLANSKADLRASSNLSSLKHFQNCSFQIFGVLFVKN